MGKLSDALAGYVERDVKHHTGLHYVPSFNDMNTNSNDDLEREELGTMRAMAMASERMPDVAPQVDTTKKLMTNKADEWGQFHTSDLHKINVADHTRSARHIYDMPKPGAGHSVWEHIIKSEKLRGTSFKNLDQDGDGRVSTGDLAHTLRVSKSDAARLLAEADINMDGVITEDEYRSMLTHYGSE